MNTALNSEAGEADFRVYYSSEEYLFGTVTVRFQEQKTLSAFDFFCIIIWKANRAKSKIAKRLLTKGYRNLDEAVNALLSQIYSAKSEREKLGVLIEQWGFLLPMSTAILTVLYPEDFTIYDIRVCDALGTHHKLSNLIKYEAIWSGYQSYLADVKKHTPNGLNLRDKDRWL